MELSKFSDIEPKESGDEPTEFEFAYNTQSPVTENDTISFSVALIARFSPPGGDSSQAGKPKPLRFNFSHVSLR
jgi:hypothetical protein